jgi:hypothetical protein
LHNLFPISKEQELLFRNKFKEYVLAFDKIANRNFDYFEGLVHFGFQNDLLRISINTFDGKISFMIDFNGILMARAYLFENEYCFLNYNGNKVFNFIISLFYELNIVEEIFLSLESCIIRMI